jgi:hypothetical protein
MRRIGRWAGMRLTVVAKFAPVGHPDTARSQSGGAIVTLDRQVLTDARACAVAQQRTRWEPSRGRKSDWAVAHRDSKKK